MKKYTALIFALAMILSLFSACTGNDSDPTTTMANETTAIAATTQADATQTEAGTTVATTSAAQSDLPDAVPAELTDVAALNSFATNLYIKYVKPNIFTAPASLFSDAEREDARKALSLVIDAETKAIAIYDKNESFYFLRGKAYEQSYYDTKDSSMKEKGLADLQKALDMGLAMAQSNYDALNAAQ
jgi:hypothetical protein